MQQSFQISMAMITLTSKCNTSLSQTLPFPSNNNNFRDASFSSALYSSYLNSAEETFVHKLAAPSQNQSPTIATQEEKNFPERKEQEDGEIGVFGAEKYFNGAMDDSPRIVKVGARNYHYVNDGRVDPVVVKPRIQAGTGTGTVTPSVRSESSWNSQSALLQSGLKNNQSQKKTNKVQGKGFLSGLRRKCSCSDKDSVDINERVGETSFKRSADSDIVQGKANSSEPNKATQLLDTVQTDKPGKEDVLPGRENCFSFPTMDSEKGNHPIKVNLQEGEEEKPRKSLEVFGCPVFEKRNKSLSLERRLTMLSWDATPRLEEIQLSVPLGEIYNETDSDASSDLFEIESLTGKSNPFLARQGSDATSGCVTPTAYAPSEASIEWSVVTASAADFSTMSDCEDIRPPTTATSPAKTFSTSLNAKSRITTAELPKRRPSISLGCKSQKAVRVAGDAHLMNRKANIDPRMRRMSGSYAPVVTRFQSETNLAGFDPRPRQNALAATRLLPRSHSPRASHLLYIQ